MNQAIRMGRFTSSEIYKLMTLNKAGNDFGAPALTYIKETNIERKLMRSLDTDAYSNDMAWGQFLEMVVFSMLGTEYQITSKDTEIHPTINCWAGSKDLIVQGVKISDIKCYQPKNFAAYTDVLLTKDVDLLRLEFPKEYWQLVSNAIISDVPNAEAITYMPTLAELHEIRQLALDYTGADQWKYRFIYEREIDKLAYLPENSFYSPLNKFQFHVPKEDIELLTNTVLAAEKKLIPFNA